MWFSTVSNFKYNFNTTHCTVKAVFWKLRRWNKDNPYGAFLNFVKSCLLQSVAEMPQIMKTTKYVTALLSRHQWRTYALPYSSTGAHMSFIDCMTWQLSCRKFFDNMFNLKKCSMLGLHSEAQCRVGAYAPYSIIILASWEDGDIFRWQCFE